jgi:apolipoprotein N-acyltransferase
VTGDGDHEVAAEHERHWRGRAAALVVGGIPALAFPEPSIWPLAYVGLIPLLLMLRAAPARREAAVRGGLGGTGFLLATHHWLLPNVTVFLPLLALALGALWIPWGWAAHALLGGRVTRGASVGAVVVLAGGWVLIEVIRAWEYLGGPFGLLGGSQWNNIPMLSAASIGGVWLVGYVVVGVNVAIVAAIAARDLQARAIALGVAVLLGALGPLYYLVAPAPDGARTLRMAIVQPGVTPGPDVRFNRGEELTRTVNRGDVDLVVWGESSVGFDLDERPDLRTRLEELAVAADADVLVNVDARSTRGGIYKSSVLVGPDGIESRYDKMRLVPFGEYIPLRPVLGWITGLTEAAREDRSRGMSLNLFTGPGFDFGPLVCFESAFPDLARTFALMGADMIIVQSATSTFQESWAPETHASLAALRAVETGRPVLHSTLTGVTAAFDANGRRHLWLATDRSGARFIEMPLASRRTPYLVFGDWVVYLSLATVIGAGFLLRRRIRPDGRGSLDRQRHSPQ